MEEVKERGLVTQDWNSCFCGRVEAGKLRTSLGNLVRPSVKFKSERDSIGLTRVECLLMCEALGLMSYTHTPHTETERKESAPRMHRGKHFGPWKRRPGP